MGDEEKDTIQLNRSRFEIYCEKLKINPNLFMLKVTLFMMYGATGSLLPFLTIHMQSIGLTVEEIAIVYLALPLTTFLSPPVTGFLVDKFGHYKPVVLFSLVLNLLFHHSLMMIPQMEIPGEVPPGYIMRHPTTEKVEVWWSPCRSRECPDDEHLWLKLHECADHCLLQPPKNDTKNNGYRRVPIPPRPVVCTNQQSCNHNVNGLIQDDELKFEIGNGRKKGNKTSARKLHLNNSTSNGNKTQQIMLFNGTTPQKPMSILDLKDSIKSNSVKQGLGKTRNETNVQAIEVRISMHPDLGEAIENLGLAKLPAEDEEVTNFTQHFGKELFVKAGVNFTALENEDLRCGGVVLSPNNTSSSTYKILKELAADCMVQKCTFSYGGPEVCPPGYKGSEPHVFWLYFFLRFFGTTMLSASVTVMDPIALTMIQKYGGEFGRERLFSTLGMALFSPLTGVLIDFKSKKLGYTDYSVAFYIYDTLLLISTVSLLLMPIGAKQPADNIMRDMLRLIKLPHVIMFIFFLFMLGNCWGFIESYLFLYLKELGAPNYLLGITVTVGTLSSIPFLYGAERISQRIGHVNIIVIAFFAHAARLVGYSLIESAWWCFPFEAIEAVSVHLMWVSAATYCAMIAPKALLATLIGVLGMSHFSLGRGSGSFAGGLLIGTYGTRQAFQIMGLLSVICGFIYGVFHFFWLHIYDEAYTNKSQDKTTVPENDEEEKLNHDELEREASLREKMKSAERLSLMIRFNHRGSLTSLDRGSRQELFRTSSYRRSSISVDTARSQTKASSSPKIDLLKSTLEIGHLQKSSNPQINIKTPQPQPLQRHTTKVTSETVPITSPQTTRKSIKSTPIEDYRNRSNSIPEEEEAVNELRVIRNMINTNSVKNKTTEEEQSLVERKLDPKHT